jgi:hypothetical protein
MTDELAKGLSSLKYIGTGLRMAFDRISEDGLFQTAIERLKKAGVQKKMEILGT